MMFAMVLTAKCLIFVACLWVGNEADKLVRSNPKWR